MRIFLTLLAGLVAFSITAGIAVFCALAGGAQWGTFGAGIASVMGSFVASVAGFIAASATYENAR